MNRRFILVSLIAISFVAPLAGAATPDEIEKAYKRGQADWDRGDPVSAMPHLKVAADGGHAASQALLAYALDQADNDAEAAELYRKAADQGNAEGMFGLAAFHMSGDGGVTRDMKAARALFVRAAESGHMPAVSVLVLSHIHGGLELSDEERGGASALYWYRKGAAAGLTPAIEKLIDANRNGKLGLALNKEEADRLQAQLNEIRGFDPSSVKKKRQRQR